MTTPCPHHQSIAIIGAGIAGLSCAAALLDAGHRVTLFDKGRSPGGRVATRRASRTAGGASFDHGAQFATARNSGFGTLLQDLQTTGTVAPWHEAQRGADTPFIGVPGMSALPRAMAEHLIARGAVIHSERHVAWLHADGTLRHLPAADAKPGSTQNIGGETTERFDAVLLALPAPQARPLLATRDSPLAAAIEAVAIAPCWAVMASFETRIDAPAVIRPTSGPLAWIACNSARPGHSAMPEAWVLHAGTAWSKSHLEDPADHVCTALMAAFADAIGTAPPSPLTLAAHRWRFAFVETPLGRPCLWDQTQAIGVCGDWCLGPRVEAAFDSGAALAQAVLGTA